VDGTVLTRLIQVIQPSDMSDEEVILVKAGLYQCLVASVSHPIETQASILPHASRLFSAGVNDQSHELQVICKKGLNVCDLITHARLPPIQRVLPKTSPTVVITAQEIDDDMEEDDEEEEEVTEQEEEVVKVVKEKKVVEEVKEIKSVHITPVTLPIAATVIKPVTLAPAEEKTIVETVKETIVITTPCTENESDAPETVDLTLPSIENTPTTPAEPAAPAAAAATSTIVLDEDEDMDMEMPMIDMAGPDSDDDEVEE